MGLERTIYTALEDQGEVQLCAVVYQPSGVDCPITFSFDLQIDTNDSSAGRKLEFLLEFLDKLLKLCIVPAVSPMDYFGTSSILSFAECQVRECILVPINDDQILELLEFFRAVLDRTDGLSDRITLNPVNAVVNILDNDGELQTILHTPQITNLLYSVPLHSCCSWSEGNIC